MNRIWSAASFLSGNLVRTRGAAAGSAVYLTFDDGPHPEHTNRLLDLLARHGAKGTFFLIGRAAEQSPGVVHRLLAEGHAIGNHSMTHPKMRTLGAAAQWAEIDRADAVLQRFGGRRRHAFRPPNGRVTPSILAFSVWRRQPLVLWTVDSLDYKLPPQGVVSRLESTPPVAGDVILFHDDGGCAGYALDVLLPAWKKAGLHFPALT